MERLRTRWAALVVALMLLLSVAGAAGASHITLPAVAAPPAQEQADKEHGASDDEDTDGQADVPEDEDADEDQDADGDAAEGAQGEHGALVSAVAQNEECVGGPHENHGWAVSQVARGLQVPAAGECPVWDPEAIVTDDPETADTDKVKGGKSAEHRQDKADKKAKTHGRWATQP